MVPSPNFGQRRNGLKPVILLIHYTGMRSADAAIKWLADPSANVSAHYVIDEHGAITQMVLEEHRAWHAGVSSWDGESDINSASIGIELQNPGHLGDAPRYPRAQIDALIALGKDIGTRHPISPRCVLAHSDVAPGRKIDPGEKFDWKRLCESGLGHWVPPVAIGADHHPASRADRHMAISLLTTYGYGVGEVDRDNRFVTILAAFQRHFRPARVDGVLDRSTIETLKRLVGSIPETKTRAELAGIDLAPSRAAAT